MQVTCNYLIKEIDARNNSIRVEYSLPGYPDVTVNIHVPNVEDEDIDKIIRSRLPYMSWTPPKPIRPLPQTLVNKVGEISFDDSIMKVLTEEEALKRSEELKAKQLFDLKQNINSVLLEQENTTL